MATKPTTLADVHADLRWEKLSPVDQEKVEREWALMANEWGRETYGDKWEPSVVLDILKQHGKSTPRASYAGQVVPEMGRQAVAMGEGAAILANQAGAALNAAIGSPLALASEAIPALKPAAAKYYESMVEPASQRAQRMQTELAQDIPERQWAAGIGQAAAMLPMTAPSSALVRAASAGPAYGALAQRALSEQIAAKAAEQGVIGAPIAATQAVAAAEAAPEGSDRLAEALRAGTLAEAMTVLPASATGSKWMRALTGAGVNLAPEIPAEIGRAMQGEETDYARLAQTGTLGALMGVGFGERKLTPLSPAEARAQRDAFIAKAPERLAAIDNQIADPRTGEVLREELTREKTQITKYLKDESDWRSADWRSAVPVEETPASLKQINEEAAREQQVQAEGMTAAERARIVEDWYTNQEIQDLLLQRAEMPKPQRIKSGGGVTEAQVRSLEAQERELAREEAAVESFVRSQSRETKPPKSPGYDQLQRALEEGEKASLRAADLTKEQWVNLINKEKDPAVREIYLDQLIGRALKMEPLPQGAKVPSEYATEQLAKQIPEAAVESAAMERPTQRIPESDIDAMAREVLANKKEYGTYTEQGMADFLWNAKNGDNFERAVAGRILTMLEPARRDRVTKLMQNKPSVPERARTEETPSPTPRKDLGFATSPFKYSTNEAAIKYKRSYGGEEIPVALETAKPQPETPSARTVPAPESVVPETGKVPEEGQGVGREDVQRAPEAGAETSQPKAQEPVPVEQATAVPAPAEPPAPMPAAEAIPAPKVETPESVPAPAKETPEPVPAPVTRQPRTEEQQNFLNKAKDSFGSYKDAADTVREVITQTQAGIGLEPKGSKEYAARTAKLAKYKQHLKALEDADREERGLPPLAEEAPPPPAKAAEPEVPPRPDVAPETKSVMDKIEGTANEVYNQVLKGVAKPGSFSASSLVTKRSYPRQYLDAWAERIREVADIGKMFAKNYSLRGMNDYLKAHFDAANNLSEYMSVPHGTSVALAANRMETPMIAAVFRQQGRTNPILTKEILTRQIAKPSNMNFKIPEVQQAMKYALKHWDDPSLVHIADTIKQQTDESWLAVAKGMAMVEGRKADSRIPSLQKAVAEAQAELASAVASNYPDDVILFAEAKLLKREKQLAATKKRVTDMGAIFREASLGIANIDRVVGMADVYDLPIKYRSNYVKGAYEKDTETHTLQDFASRKNTGGSSMKAKKFDSYLEAMEVGERYNPRDLRGDVLTQSATLANYRMANGFSWEQSLFNLNAPDGEPLAVDFVEGSLPAGYSSVQITPGRTIGVHKDFAGLVNKLSAPSHVPLWMMKTWGGLKHNAFAFDIFHGARLGMMGAASMRTEMVKHPVQTFTKPQALYRYKDADLAKAVKAGEITQETMDAVIRDRPIIEEGLRAGANLVRISDALYKDVAPMILPGARKTNKFIFDTVCRSIMASDYIARYRRNESIHPEWSKYELARNTAKEINTYYRNFQSQGWFVSKSWKDMSRLILFAPEWTEGMVKTDADAFVNLAKDSGRAAMALKELDPKKAQVSNQTAAMSAGLITFFALNQLINYMSREKPTWENEEPGQKLAAYIPGTSKDNPGHFLDTMSVFLEGTHELLKYKDQKGNYFDAAVQIFLNKMHQTTAGFSRAIYGKDFKSDPMTTGERVYTAARGLVPAPFMTEPALRTAAKGLSEVLPEDAGKDTMKRWSKMGARPGEAQSQVMATAGLKTATAKTPGQDMFVIAQQWKRDKGLDKKGDFPPSEYGDLRKALKDKDRKEANRLYKELLAERVERKAAATGATSPEEKDEIEAEETKVIERYFAGLGKKRMTGLNASAEEQFYRSLSIDRRRMYHKAVRDNENLGVAFDSLVKRD